ncbi:MAG: DUF3486 family protein [Gammaproteobacteria bacterium]|nr:DUF3486 family protein [Gammaproteobacteria bacterium]
MPPRSSITNLPDDLRAAFNAKLVANAFSDYQGLADWLNGELESRGMELRVSRSAAHRHGQEFEGKLEKMRIATEQAKAVASGSEDDEGAMNEALIRLVQTKTFDALMAMGDGAEDGKNLGKLGVMIARLVRASVTQKQWAADAKKKIKEKLDSLESVTEAGGVKAFDPDTLRRVREEIYGVYE